MKKLFIALFALLVQFTIYAQTPSESPVILAEEGQQAPEIALPGLQGDTLTLSSLRGKYVVIDFWGSWCGWCIKGFPKMKEYYAKYRDKMEILGVDCRDTEVKWKAAVNQYQLPWKHVRSELGQAQATYRVQGYPCKVIVDPSGKILKTILGESEEFYTYLDELLG